MGAKTATPAHASGTNSQLQVTTTKNGVTYVTTTLASGSANSTVTYVSTTSTTSGGLFGGPISPPMGFFANITDIFNTGLKVVFVFAEVLVFVALIWGAFEWITSGGDKAKTESARSRIVSAIVGLVIVLSSFAIITLIVRLLGYNNFNEVLNLLGGSTTTSTQTQTATDSSQLRNQNLVQ